MGKNIWCDTICNVYGDVYFSCVNIPALFKLNVKEHVYDFITFLSNDNIILRRNPNIIQRDGILYLFPDTATEIIKYEIENSEISYIKIKNTENTRLSIYISFFYKNEIVFVSEGTKKIYSLNLETSNVIEIYDLKDVIGDGKLSKSFCVVESELFLLIPNKKMICSYRLDTGVVDIKILPNEFTGNAIEYYDGYFYISGTTSEIIVIKHNSFKQVATIQIPDNCKICSFENHKVQMYDLHTHEGERYLFKEIRTVGDKLIFIPYYLDKILIYRIKEDKIINLQVEAPIQGKKLLENEGIVCRGGCVCLDSHYLVYSSIYDKYLDIDIENERALTFDIKLNNEEKYIIRSLELNKNIDENIINLKDYIKYIYKGF